MEEAWITSLSPEGPGAANAAELIIFCSCQGRVRVADDDSWALCPHCQQRLRVISGRVQRADSYRQQGLIAEQLTVAGEECPFVFQQRSEVSSGSEVSAVFQASISGRKQDPIGLSDHSRKLWFPATPRGKAPASLLSARRIFLRVVAIIAALLALAAFILTANHPLLLLAPLAVIVALELFSWRLRRLLD
jgi:hypothetical protein